MENSNFVDYVKIFCRSGAGGAGSVHFRRDKLTAKGGPDGGDGGRGGHIILRGNSQLWTLLHLKFRKHVFSQDGDAGKGAMKTGKSGDDVILEVPLGTVARDASTR
ncbi:MAG: GTPase ObgE, partial [Bacteroidota bacterium]